MEHWGESYPFKDLWVLSYPILYVLLLRIEYQIEKDRRIEWRRSKVQELSSQGHDQREIAQILQVSKGTVNGDLAYPRLQAKTNIRKYIDERLSLKYE